MSGAAVGWGASTSTSSMVESGGHDARPARCPASGWRLRVACTDGTSGAICPVCDEPVGAYPDDAVGPGVWAIQEHASWAP
jgi:hypothetical protein